MNFEHLFILMIYMVIVGLLILFAGVVEKIIDSILKHKEANSIHLAKRRKIEQEKIAERNRTTTFKTALDFDKDYKENKSFSTIGFNIILKEGEINNG